jgi:rSAM/selenodomain-associated transferase 2
VKLSAVIPTWCEAARIATTVRDCLQLADEVIVADASSPDGTAELARSAGAMIVQAPKGRGPQLDCGSRAATGDVLLFVHADTRVPREARIAIERSLQDPAIIGGNFKLRFEPRSPVAVAFAYANHVRRKLFNLYYGDSCIFVRRSVYETLGGFGDLPVCEDHRFVRRLERLGRTHYEQDVCVATSSRRFARTPLRTVANWGMLQLLYALGVDARRLSRWYSDAR